ncbi:hypothetical protein evm_011183 [Chilo suppressalis]|nr:hypothetical protein evm_011183 [Chilo suppressalis]
MWAETLSICYISLQCNGKDCEAKCQGHKCVSIPNAEQSTPKRYRDIQKNTQTIPMKELTFDMMFDIS